MHLILGIKGRSILFKLKLIEFPRSFSIDIMHLFFENVVSQMFKLWSNQFFKEDNLNNLLFSFILSKSFWEEIGQIMNKNKKSVPLKFGRLLYYIFKHHTGYKAKEWANWITLYSISLLKYYM